MGPLGNSVDDTRCVMDVVVGDRPKLVNCDNVSNVRQKTWNFSQVKRFHTQNCDIDEPDGAECPGFDETFFSGGVIPVSNH